MPSPLSSRMQASGLEPLIKPSHNKNKPMSEDQKKKISSKMKEHHAKQEETREGYIKKLKTNEKISQSNLKKNRKITEEHRDAITESNSTREISEKQKRSALLFRKKYFYQKGNKTKVFYKLESKRGNYKPGRIMD